jgi:hypothetical protein
MQIQELIILTLLSLSLSLKDTPKVEVQIPENQPISDNQFRSYTLEEIEKLDKKIEEAYKNSYNRDRLCSDRSDIYKQLALKKVDSIFKPCISKLLKMTKVPLVFPPLAPIDSFENVKHYAYISSYGTDINKYRITITWNILERYQTNVSFVSGEELTSKFPTLSSIFVRDYSDLKNLEVRNPTQYKGIYNLASSPVSLSKGKMGYYIPMICGAHCHGSYSRVLWENNGYAYEVGINRHVKEQVIELANSTINNQY